MKPLRLKVTFFTFMLILLGCGSTIFALKTFFNISAENQSVRQSVLLRDWVEALPNQPIRDEIVKDLQISRAELSPVERQNSLSDIIQAYNSGNRALLKKRVDAFISNEKRYVANLSPQIMRMEQHMVYFGAIVISILFVGLIGLRGFIVSNIFEHLQNTTQRMIDFLNGKYSYQFEVPPPNEVGDLQSTFNSMAQRVLQNVEELKALDAAKSDFLNIASHELRTPMTSIKGSLGLLTSGVMGEIPEEALQMVEIAESETNRLIRLINDILDMAKIEAGKFPLNFDWTNINALLETTREGLLGLSGTAGVNVQVNAELFAESYADRDRIQQVIMNLASNAIKFSPKGSTVTIGCFVDEDDMLRIYVTDQGRGISPEDQKLLFEKFRQVTGPDNPLVQGTGLGLAIAKALVEEHNGFIGVHSAPGKGSTFYFTLPKWRHVENESDADTIEQNDPNYRAAA